MKKTQNKELYLSIDIEADGPIPNPFSMLSFAAVLFNEKGVELNAIECNLKPLPHGKQDPGTMEWWSTQKEAWNYVQKNPQEPVKAMTLLYDFLKKYVDKGYKIVPMSSPITFDFMFLYWYMRRFIPEDCLFHFNGIDIRTYAMCKLGKSHYRGFKVDKLLDYYKIPRPTHKAIDDARSYGQLYFKLKKE